MVEKKENISKLISYNKQRQSLYLDLSVGFFKFRDEILNKGVS